MTDPRGAIGRAGEPSGGIVPGLTGRGLASRGMLAAGRVFAVARERAQLAPADRLPLALYVSFTVLAFVVSLVATFPHELLVRRLLLTAERAPVEVEVTGVRMGWMLAYTLDSVRLTPRGGDGAIPVLQAARVQVAPSLLGLLRGSPYPVALRADLYGGTLAGSVDLRPRAYAVRAALADVDVSRYEGLRLFIEGTLVGRLDANVELRGDAANPATTTGALELRATDVALEGGKVRGIIVPDLHFRDVQAAGTIKAGRFEIADMAASGRELNVRGEGNLRLQHPLATSVMSLALTVRPAEAVPDNLRLALNLIPGDVGAAGERTLRLVGPLRQPRVQ